jgi:excisionase family DNA binding protein
MSPLTIDDYRLHYRYMKDVSDVYLTPEQVAEQLHLSTETIYRWLRSRKLRGSRISHKAWRVAVRDVQSFVRRRNVSELLFEEYAEEYNLGSMEREPQFPGSSRRIDFRVSHPQYPLWFEVKQFDADPQITGNGGGAFDPHIGVRAKIAKAAEQFRDYDNECCSLVLFNEELNLTDICTPRIVLGAMLGSVGFVVPFNETTADWSGTPVVDNVFMDGGKMIHPHIKTPQNTTISAVIALERFTVGQSELQIAVERQELVEQRVLSIEEHLKILADNRDAYSRRVLRTIVYENPHANKPLPRDIFVGPFDERWGQEGDLIRQVFIGAELRKLTETEHELGLDQSPFMRHAQRRARQSGNDQSTRQRDGNRHEI